MEFLNVLSIVIGAAIAVSTFVYKIFSEQKEDPKKNVKIKMAMIISLCAGLSIMIISVSYFVISKYFENDITRLNREREEQEQVLFILNNENDEKTLLITSLREQINELEEKQSEYVQTIVHLEEAENEKVDIIIDKIDYTVWMRNEKSMLKLKNGKYKELNFNTDFYVNMQTNFQIYNNSIYPITVKIFDAKYFEAFCEEECISSYYYDETAKINGSTIAPKRYIQEVSINRFLTEDERFIGLLMYHIFCRQDEWNEGFEEPDPSGFIYNSALDKVFKDALSEYMGDWPDNGYESYINLYLTTSQDVHADTRKRIK